MARNFYCGNCGKQLTVSRKAIPRAGVILDIVHYHECSAEMQSLEIDLSHPVIAETSEGKDKFVKSLNGLKPTIRPSSMIGTDDLRDRRFEKDEIKSTAPQAIQDIIGGMMPSAPAHEFKSEGGLESEE